nr:ribosomal protein L22 [uncultured bacterium]
MIAVAKNIRISPRKANLIALMVGGKNALEASALLARMPKKGAQIIKKVLDSAIANAVHNEGQSAPDLRIARILTLKAPTLKRFLPISRGRATPILKRSSHIRVELSL